MASLFFLTWGTTGARFDFWNYATSFQTADRHRGRARCGAVRGRSMMEKWNGRVGSAARAAERPE